MQWFVLIGMLLVAVAMSGCAPGVALGSQSFERSQVRAVIASWRAAFNAADAAARAGNPFDPVLRTTHVNRQLTIIETNLGRESAAGERAVGHDTVRYVTVLHISGNQAEVAACIQGGEVLVSASTDRPVAGQLGQKGLEGVRSLMVRSRRMWKLSEQSVVQGGCPYR